MGHALALAEIRRMGVEVVIATGRPLLTTRWIWQELGLASPLVCFNGGWVGYPDRSPLVQCRLAEAQVLELLGALEGADGAVCCYPDANTWIMSRETPFTRFWREIYQVPIEIRPDLARTWRGDSLKLMFVAGPERVPALQREIHARFGERFQVVISQSDRIEILPRLVTKAWGLARLAERLGIDRAAVWAVGDADNDLEMISWAGCGCAMGQASETLRAAARIILPGVQARGLCALVPRLEAALRAGDRA
jgi:Cof subfamily protein (haloacid dehalogenase superfamily)